MASDNLASPRPASLGTPVCPQACCAPRKAFVTGYRSAEVADGARSAVLRSGGKRASLRDVSHGASRCMQATRSRYTRLCRGHDKCVGQMRKLRTTCAATKTVGEGVQKAFRLFETRPGPWIGIDWLSAPLSRGSLVVRYADCRTNQRGAEPRPLTVARAGRQHGRCPTSARMGMYLAFASGTR
jgi:hypothetical protein